ncbi:MAG TPA: hypothetical protein VM223_04115 [Planctomycetota bacterium]|nr:hypothetical protein [Planctomycetota bacterium]
MLRLFLGFAICGLLLFMAGPARGGEAPATLEDLAKENATLKKEIQDLRKLVEERLKPQEGVPVEEEKTLRQEIDELKKALPANKFPMLSSLKVELYGFIKLDASYDTAHVRPGNYAYWVDSEATNKHDNEFNMTANETRLGLSISGPQVGEAMTSGRFEMDFYGGGPENKSNPMLRLAYVKLDWPDYDFSVLAGQNWDIISPLAPSSINYIVNGFAGNIGYRRPQVRVSQAIEVNETSKVLFEGGLFRTIGDVPYTGGKDSGEDSGFPTLQGRMAITCPVLTEKPTTIGFSGHWGREEYDIPPGTTGDDVVFNTWSGNVDLTMPIAGPLSIRGEGYMGENLDSYVGGIGYGVNPAAGREIGVKGGWMCVSIVPNQSWEFNVGSGFEDNDKNDMVGMSASSRTRNRNFFGNVLYNISKAAQVGVELSQWKTDYKGTAPGRAVRVESAIKYKF